MSREIDILIAEKVMGFVWKRAPVKQWALKALVPTTDPDAFWTWKDLQGDERVALDGQRYIPHYSTDIAAAWEVVQALMKRPGVYAVHVSGTHETGWGCTITLANPIDQIIVYDQSDAPMAICEAALELLSSSPTETQG